MRTARTRVMTGVLGAALLVGGAGSAFAVNSSNGGVSSWSSGSSNKTANVKDLGADGFSVKAEYKRSGDSSKKTITETRGKGNTNSSTGSTSVTHIHGCVVKPAFPDSCAAWDPRNPF